MKIVQLVFVMFLIALQLLPATINAQESRPNVLFIAVDDLNDWIGCMGGHPQAITPNIDRLAQQGILFTNAYCAAPVCLASRTAVFSGRYPIQTGVYSNWGETKGKPPAKDLQLLFHMNQSGYQTLGAGKLYHNTPKNLFDEYFDTEQRWSPFTQEQARYSESEISSKGSSQPRHLLRDGPGKRSWTLPLNGLPSERNADTREGESFDWGQVDVHDDEMGDVRITSWAQESLRRKFTAPFFLGVGYYRPHIPLFAPKQDFDSLPPLDEIRLPSVLEGDLDDLGPQAKQVARDAITAGTHSLVLQSGQWKQAVRSYLASIHFVDRQIGRILDALESSAYSQNTWIVFWSDHGWQLGEKEHWGKWTPWRQSTRVPLIIVPPKGQVAARGRVCEEPASLIDLYPTLIDACRLPQKEGLSGKSLVPFLTNPELRTGRAVLTSVDPGNHAISTKDWRFLRYSNGEKELYDLQNDSREWNNLAHSKDHKSKVLEMENQLDELTDLLVNQASTKPKRSPNILWLVGENLSHDLGCYGATNVHTPNLDRLAAQGVRYTRVFSTNPACAPSRSAFFLGMYQTSTDTHPMRSHRADSFKLPEGIRPITHRLRDAGYFTANIKTVGVHSVGTGKLDLNFVNEGPIYHPHSEDWSSLKPNQPFFAVVNAEENEYDIYDRKTAEKERVEWVGERSHIQHASPERVVPPPYYPDHPVVREEWARYLNSVSGMDLRFGKVLEQLRADGLEDDTIIIFFGDNGRLEPRGIHWCYDNGLRVPMIIRWPKNFPAPAEMKEGTVDDRLLSLIDVTASTLEMAGVEKPPLMQGRIFLGPRAEPPRKFVFAARDRIDETQQRIRSVHDDRFHYIKTFSAGPTFASLNRYKEKCFPILQIMRQLDTQGQLSGPSLELMRRSGPCEELYDTQTDPHEIRNLITSTDPHVIAALNRLRAALDTWIIETGDRGATAEPIETVAPFAEEMHKWFGTPAWYSASNAK